MNNAEIGNAMVIKLDAVLPEYPTFKEGVRRAPKRELTLNKREIKLAVANALRYVPEELHEQLAPEFLDELLTHGRIYGYRFMPKERIYGKPIDEYKGECVEGKAFQVMTIWTMKLLFILMNWLHTAKPDRFARTGCSIS